MGNNKNFKKIIKSMIAVAKAGFEAFASAVWIGVAMVIFNSYAVPLGIDFSFTNLGTWMSSCGIVSLLFYSIVNVKAVKDKE